MPEKNVEKILEPRYEPQCRLCQWSKHKEELYKVVVDLVMQGIPYGKVAGAFKKYLEEGKHDEKPLTRKSIWNHFERHMPPKAEAAITVARSSWVPTEGIPLVIEHKLREEASKGRFDEYEELCELYLRFKEAHNKIYELEASLQVQGDGGTAAWSQNKIQTYVSMVNTQKSILGEIAKMRQGDKLVALAAKFIIEEFVRAVIGKIKSEFDAFTAVMKRQGVSSEVVEAFEEITQERMVRLFSEEADSAMTITRKEFKLPN
jgi:hypothetical protein